MLKIATNAAEFSMPFANECFEFEGDVVGARPPVRIARSAKRAAPADTLAHSNTTSWISSTFPVTATVVEFDSELDDPICVPGEVKSEPLGQSDWMNRIEVALSQNMEDAQDSDGIIVQPRAVRALLSIARQFAPYMTMTSFALLRFGAFVEDDGCLALVIQSLESDRRLTCRVSPDGNSIRVIRIDERMSSAVSRLDPLDGDAPRELAEWVQGKA